MGTGAVVCGGTSEQQQTTYVDHHCLLCCANRRFFGLKAIQRFEDITQDPELAAALKRLYNSNINDVDAYVGALAEPKHGNGHVGELIYRSIYDQFRRLRDGDWWYFGNLGNGMFTIDQISEIKTTGKAKHRCL